MSEAATDKPVVTDKPTDAVEEEVKKPEVTEEATAAAKDEEAATAPVEAVKPQVSGDAAVVEKETTPAVDNAETKEQKVDTDNVSEDSESPKTGGGELKLLKELDDEAPKTFPQVLMEILSNEEDSDTISWLPHGRSFIIYKKKKFAAQVLPKFFKATKFTSFTRKLNRWGFTRVTRGPEMGSYYHKLFLREEPSLCLRMSSHSSSKFQEQPQLMPNPMAGGGGMPFGGMPFGMPGMGMPGMNPMMQNPMGGPGGPGGGGMPPGDLSQQNQMINQQLQQLQWQQFQLQQLQQQQHHQQHMGGGPGGGGGRPEMMGQQGMPPQGHPNQGMVSPQGMQQQQQQQGPPQAATGGGGGEGSR